MAGSIAKAPWRLGVILFLLAAFIVSMFLYQSFGGERSNGIATEVTAGSTISSAGPDTALPGPSATIPPGSGNLGIEGDGANAPGLSGFPPTFATFSPPAISAVTVPGVTSTDIPGPQASDPPVPPAPPATGSLSGTVIKSLAFCVDDCDAENTPLGDINVFLADADRNLTGQTTITDAAGAFRFNNLAPGEYNLFFVDPVGTYGSEWYVPQTIIAGDSAIVVVANQNTGILMLMQPVDAGSDTGGISGMVSNSFGKGISGVTVMAFLADTDTGELLTLQDLAITDIDGKYHIAGLPSRTGPVDQSQAAGYKVLFSPSVNSGFTQQWYQDQPTAATAKLIALPPHQEISGIDAILSGGGNISGQVTGEGLPLAGITVDIYDESGVIVGSCLSGPEGDFDSGPLASGSYRLRAAGTDDYLEEWYNDKQSFDAADPVVVTTGQGNSGLVIDLDPAPGDVIEFPAIMASRITNDGELSDPPAATDVYPVIEPPEPPVISSPEPPVIEPPEPPVISSPDNNPGPAPTGSQPGKGNAGAGSSSSSSDHEGSSGSIATDVLAPGYCRASDSLIDGINPPGCQSPGAADPRR